MLLTTALKGMTEARNALQQTEGISVPTFISEEIQKLAQYTAAVEETLADDESDMVKKKPSVSKNTWLMVSPLIWLPTY